MQIIHEKKPSADFSAIPAEPAIQQAEPDAPAMQAESVRRISVPARSDWSFVQIIQQIFFRNYGSSSISIRKTETEDFSQIFLSHR
jgi:hypothetical protein